MLDVNVGGSSNLSAVERQAHNLLDDCPVKLGGYGQEGFDVSKAKIDK